MKSLAVQTEPNSGGGIITAAKTKAGLSPFSLLESLLPIRGSGVSGEIVACITLAATTQASSK